MIFSKLIFTSLLLLTPLASFADLSIRVQLSDIFTAQKAATSHTAWESHKNHPNQALIRILSNSPNKQELCFELLRLKVENKILLYNTFKDNFLTLPLPCYTQFLNKTEFYLKTIADKLSSGRRVRTVKLNIPTEIIALDTSGGPRLVYADLPPKTIALTFDDGPSPKTTLKLLDILDRHQVKANFFSTGQNIQRYKKITAEIAKRGHFVGNHSWSHRQMSKMKYSEAKNEIIDTFDLLDQIIENWVPFFRYPYGARSKRVTQFLQSENVPQFFWAIDTLDWKYSDPKYLFKYALKQIKTQGRGIVLFHDIQPQTIAIMPALLDALRQQGFRTVAFTPQ